MGRFLKNCFEIVYDAGTPEEEFELICRECWQEDTSLPPPHQTYCYSSAPQEFLHERCDACNRPFWRRTPDFTAEEIQHALDQIIKAKAKIKSKTVK